jgi:hypothetical protein
LQDASPANSENRLLSALCELSPCRNSEVPREIAARQGERAFARALRYAPGDF